MVHRESSSIASGAATPLAGERTSLPQGSSETWGYKIAEQEAFPPGTRMRVDIEGVVIAVFNVDGRYYAIRDRCPHQFAHLSRGRLQGTVVCSAATDWETEWVHEGEVVVCPGHSLEFDLRTGEAYGQKPFKLATYHVGVENGDVVLWMNRRTKS